MNNQESRENIIEHEEHSISSALNLMQIPRRVGFFKLFLVGLALIGIVSLAPVMSLLTTNITIRSSGSIAPVSVMPLHVDGKYVKDVINRTVYLRGVWFGDFLDTSTGWWGPSSAFAWNESELNSTLQTLKTTWGVNVVNCFIWGDWWLNNSRGSLVYGNNFTNIGERDAVIRSVQVAEAYGIYVQIRLYSPSRALGRIEGLPFQPAYSWSVQDFVNFWVNVSNTLKPYPNVIYCLFDEPTGNEATWFTAASQTIAAMRGNGTNQLILMDYGYCADMLWVADWVNGGYPLYNVFFCEHIYRWSGTFAFNMNAPTDINYIRTFLTKPPALPSYTGTGTKYIIDTYNVPIWVGAIGAYNGVTNDAEYTAFVNTLQVLNEFGIGYVVFSAMPTNTPWFVLNSPGDFSKGPNRVGQALINAIAGIVPPGTYQLTVNSNLASVPFNISGYAYSTPFGPAAEPAGIYAISVPSSISINTHIYNFASWEDNSTSPTRTINLSSNMNLTATYQAVT